MMYRLILTVIFIAGIVFGGLAQNCGKDIFASLQSPGNKFFFSQEGKSVGSYGVLECFYATVYVYYASYDKHKNEFEIKLRIIDGVTDAGDTVGLEYADAFLARPVHSFKFPESDTLTEIRDMGHGPREKIPGAVFPKRRGDFDLHFKADPDEKLYLYRGGYALVEFNIDKIVSGGVKLGEF